MQLDLAGKVAPAEKPWAGICCKACWNAKGELCRCRCHKANHGKGRKPAITEEEAKEQAEKLKELMKE